jgi:hypothetical protein
MDAGGVAQSAVVDGDDAKFDFALQQLEDFANLGLAEFDRMYSTENKLFPRGSYRYMSNCGGCS